jgi:hypothetical protein
MTKSVRGNAMQELFLKTLRWYLVVMFAIGGIAALHIADVTDTIKPVLPGIVCLGASFIFATAWKEIRRKILFWTLVVSVGLAWATQYLPDVLFVLIGTPVILDDFNYCVYWGGLVTVIGFPLMMYIFHRHGD